MLRGGSRIIVARTEGFISTTTSIAMSPIIITTTADDVDMLEGIAQRLIAHRLAACCQISPPIKSIYCWNDEVESSTEYELKIKTAASKFDEVSTVIKTMHHYDVPQIIAVNIAHIDDAYRDWMMANVSS